MPHNKKNLSGNTTKNWEAEKKWAIICRKRRVVLWSVMSSSPFILWCHELLLWKVLTEQTSISSLLTDCKLTVYSGKP